MQLEVISHHPEGQARPTPVLFVHGSWHGAWCWENFLPYFAQQGYQSYALSLRGHGHSEGKDQILWSSAARDYVADVAQVAQTLPVPPIIIGHSMGGYILQRYLERYPAAAGVLLASIPVSGIYQFAIRMLQRHPAEFFKAHLLLDPWLVVSTPELTQDAFFSPGVPMQEINRHFERLGRESFLVELEALFLALPRPKKIRNTPLLVLAAENDRVFSVAEQQATARAYHTEAEIYPDMAHDMMLEPGWQKVADRILGWLKERNL